MSYEACVLKGTPNDQRRDDRMEYRYERMDEKNNIQICPLNDYDGSIAKTGNCIIGLKAWFDENIERRKELGWIKHYYYTKNSEVLEDLPEYDYMLHYLTLSTETIDAYTVRDRYHLIEKTDEDYELEEQLSTMNIYVPSGTMIVDSMGGAIL